MMISDEVLALEYVHIASAGNVPYRHDFTHKGVELWLQGDGSILLRHPTYRLWEQRMVGDDA